MGYRIEYGQTVKREIVDDFSMKKSRKRTLVLIAAVVVAAVLTFCMKSEAVYELLLPGDPAVTEEALASFAENVRAGEPMNEAAAAFCREILAGANIS